jgi:hypothetical protein
MGGSGLGGFLRNVASIVVVAGAAGSVGLTLFVGHRNPSRVLLLLFALWVLSPFMALAYAGKVARAWSTPIKTTLHVLILVLSVGSLAIYGHVAVGPPRATPAFLFLAVPLVSWLLITLVVLIAFVSGRPPRSAPPGAPKP